MKLAMTLRTRLFLSISALITVALLGLILGLVSVMQMAKTQESSIRSNFITLDLGLKLRQSLGDQLMMMLEQRPNPEALQASEQRYFELLDQGIAHEQRDGNSGGSAGPATISACWRLLTSLNKRPHRPAAKRKSPKPSMSCATA